jgi:pyrroline-5-carboxylate reductase
MLLPCAEKCAFLHAASENQAGRTIESFVMNLGFIGTGTLTASVVEGLCMKYADGRRICVSPRSEEVSRQLADKFHQVKRAESNADVVEKSDMVFLAVRPPQVAEALEGLKFRREQIVVSFIGRLAAAEVARLVAPAATICRVMPVPPIARHKGPIVIYPAVEAVIELFTGLGHLIVASDEADLMMSTTSAALMSTYFQFQNTVIDWLTAQGVRRDKASLHVRSLLEGLADTGVRTPDEALEQLPPYHETKGGSNELARRFLTNEGWFDKLREALDVLNRVRIPQPES